MQEIVTAFPFLDPELLELTQRSEEWLDARRGRITASKIANWSTRISGKTPQYVQQLFDERNGQGEAKSFTNAAMDWGNDHESLARACFESCTMMEVVPVGLCVKNNDDLFGASPDGMVKNDDAEGPAYDLVEIKCPWTWPDKQQNKFVYPDRVSDRYMKQMQFAMWVTGAKRCHYVVWAPINVNQWEIVRDDAGKIESMFRAIDANTAKQIAYEDIEYRLVHTIVEYDPSMAENMVEKARAKFKHYKSLALNGDHSAGASKHS